MEPKISILCVDDEPINLMLFKANLSKKYQVYTAESGVEGLKILNDHNEIAVVLSDMKMPEMNGIEFINKAISQFPNIIYIIITGYDITEEILKALENKIINKYFRKPYNIKQIEATIETFMQH